ncbi:DMT family transporter [Verminephrobacter eiseniae]|uniref:DMT family transporter n=1 Tax=Verminephrobacter eiseniae TaxID=364317 RepID=UPI0002EE4EFC|nr:DMT family transporter [Verminephrobacter eiseniae]
MSAARPPEGAHTVAEGEGAPSFAARPPEGAHTAAKGEGAPSFAARPPEGAHTAAEGEGAPVSAARPPGGAHTAAEGEGAPVSAPDEAQQAAAAASAARTRGIGVSCGLAVALIWSGWSVATRFAMKTELAPADVTFLRFGVAAIFLWPVLLRHGFGFKRIGRLNVCIMLIGAGVPFMMLAATGMRFAPASHVATLMIGMMPIFVALLSALFFRERFSRVQLGGLATVIVGAACLGGHALIADRGAGEWRGDLLFLCAGLCFASYTVVQRRSGISPWHATALVNVGSALVFAPIYWLFLQPRIFTAPVSDLLFQVFAQGVCAAIVAMFFYAEAVRRLGAPRAAIFGALTPAFAVLIGIPALGEIPGGVGLAGIALVMAGVVLVVTGARPRPA